MPKRQRSRGRRQRSKIEKSKIKLETLMASQTKFTKYLQKLDQAYYAGKGKVSDQEYDWLKTEYEKKYGAYHGGHSKIVEKKDLI